MLPNFLVIGAPRAGTTWIDTNLRAHPDVFMSPVKEVHFFDRHYDKGIAHYESFFASHSGQSAVGESTPDYMHGQWSKNDIPALIHKHLPDVRLIASLRNPIDRAYSRFLNAKAKRDYNAAFSFEEKLIHRPQFIREGFYFDQLQRYLVHFPREHMLFLLFDDLIADAEGFMQKIYDFLDVRADFARLVKNVNINAAAGKKNLGKSRALWFLSRALSHFEFHVAGDRLRRLNSVRISPMPKKSRVKLLAIYREHNLRLQDLIGRDLSHWNKMPDE